MPLLARAATQDLPTALAIAFDGARSPMEAIMAAMLHMPHAYGVFNIAMQLKKD